MADCGVSNYNYEHKNGVNYMGPLIIDYSLLLPSSSSPQAIEELHKFKSALSSWGCFQLINHGIPTSLLDEMREVSRQFFALATEEKLKYAMPKGDNNGYDGQTIATSDEDPSPDCNEGLNLTVYPQHRRKLDFWPEIPPNFKKLLDEYAMRVAPIFDALFKMIVHSLNVDEEEFGKRYCQNKEMNVRFNFYPRCESSRSALGLKPHADFSAITLLLQDEEGLQVLKDAQWFMVPVIPHALFLNLGDPTEIISNGMFKSAVHRVVTNTDKSRMSIATFWDSDRDREIEPLGELVTTARPQQYRRVLLKDYTAKFFECYKTGKRGIEDVKIYS